jgi:hypothetical protein
MWQATRTTINFAKLTYWDSFVPRSSVKIAGVSIIVAFILGSSYALTRPCVFGECPEITQAQQLADGAAIAAITSPAKPTLIMVRQQLEKSRTILRTIPWWSKFHKEAAILLEEYQAKFQELDILEAATETAKKAKLAANKLPLTTAQWQEICQLWQDAIALLDVITPSSIFQAAAKLQRQEYQINLAQSQRYSAEEIQAKANLRFAEEEAKLAKMREGSAQSPADWQSVQTSWQTAILHLQTITPETTTYEESRQLLSLYMTQLIKSGNREKQEASAVRIYRQAMEQAKLAKIAELKNQWQPAVFHWRSALTAIRQVPKNSFRAAEAEPLTIFYALSLNQSERKLNWALQQQKINNQLKSICQSSVVICDYFIAENIIKIVLKPAYIQQIRSTSLNAQIQGNQQIQIDLLNHIAQLEKNLQLISKEAKKRIELYNPNGGLMTIYQF